MTRWLPVTPEHARELSLLMQGDPYVEALDPDCLMGLQSSTRRTFAGMRNGSVVGELDTELRDGQLWLSIWVAEDARRQGVGSSALRFAAGLAGSTVVLRGTVDPGNSASLGLVRAAGFALAANVNEDGLIEVHRP